MLKEVSRGAYIHKLDEFDLMRMENNDYISDGRIIAIGDNKYDVGDFCDRSDKAMLTIEYNENKLKEVLKIEDNDYTHIIKDSAGCYFAVKLVAEEKVEE